jgi:hypothetical protein
VVEYLLRECEALNLNSSTAEKRRKESKARMAKVKQEWLGAWFKW